MTAMAQPQYVKLIPWGVSSVMMALRLAFFRALLAVRRAVYAAGLQCVSQSSSSCAVLTVTKARTPLDSIEPAAILGPPSSCPFFTCLAHFINMRLSIPTLNTGNEFRIIFAPLSHVCCMIVHGREYITP